MQHALGAPIGVAFVLQPYRFRDRNRSRSGAWGSPLAWVSAWAWLSHVLPMAIPALQHRPTSPRRGVVMLLLAALCLPP
tara:strand:+ start:836 stop:1072 length:237 start_codon:yes stop_codon:yes gene_type:complete